MNTIYPKVMFNSFMYKLLGLCEKTDKFREKRNRTAGLSSIPCFQSPKADLFLKRNCILCKKHADDRGVDYFHVDQPGVETVFGCP